MRGVQIQQFTRSEAALHPAEILCFGDQHQREAAGDQQ